MIGSHAATPAPVPEKDRTMNIRIYQPGDEAAQVAIYNEAAAQLPKFKAATVEEIRRRCQARDFDPSTRFYAVEEDRVAAYATFHANGRVSYPWCRPGHEHLAEPLWDKLLQAMRARGLRSAFAAYRGDWPGPLRFFEEHGFRRRREMVNFVMDLLDMPTPSVRLKDEGGPLRREDLPAVFQMAAGVMRVQTVEELEQHLFHNAYFAPESVYVLRGGGRVPSAVGLVVSNPAYADPKQIDASMPCYRLGAFGTEGMQTKRVNGLFSFLARDDSQLLPHGLDLLGHAAFRLEATRTGAVAAQVPSDALHLVGFYARYFRKQGSFPILERSL
jgi:hypothetical protein